MRKFVDQRRWVLAGWARALRWVLEDHRRRYPHDARTDRQIVVGFMDLRWRKASSPGGAIATSSMKSYRLYRIFIFIICLILL
jgi:hypothetical protein